MSIKDLFGKTSPNLEETVQDVESVAFVEEKTKAEQTYHPQIDFSDPENFVYYGSAELYYDAAIRRIYEDYPYDGSKAEQIAFEESASALERWVFENKYPKTTGHVQLGTTGEIVAPTGGQQVSTTTSPEAIRVWGGLHTDGSTNLKDKFGKSAKFDEDKNRNQNWNCDLENGVTVEFWMKKDSYDVVNNPVEIILDLWNGQTGNNEDRLYCYTANLNGVDLIGLVLNASGQPGPELFVPVTIGEWAHYAFTLKKEDSSITGVGYVNGEEVWTKQIFGFTNSSFSGLINGFIGSMQAPIQGQGSIYGGKFQGYLDEFRFWKTRRTARQIKLNWFQSIGGGANTDDATSDLGVYLKFNEGIVGNNQVDNVVLDYSGRLANGLWIGYENTTNARSTESAMETLGYTEKPSPIIYKDHPDVKDLISEMKDKGLAYDADRGQSFFRSMPTWLQEEDNGNLRLFSQILGSYLDTLHVQIKELTELKTKRYPMEGVKASTMAADLLKDKGFMISNMFESNEVYEKLAAVNLQDAQFETGLTEIKNIIYTNIYNNLEKIYKTKGTEGSIRNLIRCYGIDDELIRLNLYTDGGVQYFTDKSRPTSVKKKYLNFNHPSRFESTIFQAVTSTSNRSFISGAVDASRAAFTLEADIVVPYKKEVGETGYFATPFLSSSVMGFHEANPSDSSDLTWYGPAVGSTTAEALIQFDITTHNTWLGETFTLISTDGTTRTYKFDKSVVTGQDLQGGEIAINIGTFPYNTAANMVAAITAPLAHQGKLTSSYTYNNLSIYQVEPGSAGNTTVSTSNSNIFTITNFQGGTDTITVGNNLQVFLVKDSQSSRHAKFVMKNQDESIYQESDYIYDIYENEHYNVALRIKPKTYPYAGGVSNTSPEYDVELYAVTTNFGEIENEIILSQTITNQEGLNLLSYAKRVYAGAHRVDMDGAVQEKCDIQIGGVRAWLDYLDNDEILSHNKDVLNYGQRSAIDGSNLYLINNVQIPSQDLTILNWDFDTVLSSDSSGEFEVEDITGGHDDEIYGWVDGIIRREHKAKGSNFPLSDSSFVSYEFIQAYKKQLPESAYDAQNIYIKGEQEINFSDDDDVSDNLFIMEKSPAALISEEMLKSFSTTLEFANLIGRPVERFRLEYKDLAKARQLFFNKVESDMDFDKFFEYFKWIDSSISSMVNQLIPMSANFAGGIVDVIEPHILERDKYQRQVGLLNTVTSTEASIRGVQELKYSWRVGHAPLSGDENENCLWQKERKENDVAEEEAIRQVLVRQNDQEFTNPVVLSGSTQLISGSYAARRFSRPYSLDIGFNNSIHGGINYSENKNRDMITTQIAPGSQTQSGAPENVVIVGAGEGLGTNAPKPCKDSFKPEELTKTKFDGFAVLGKESFLSTLDPKSEENDYSYRQKISKIIPGNIVSSSVNSGYSSIINRPGANGGFAEGYDLVNLHSDTTDITNEISIQGPFTNEHVGGRQSRHIHLMDGADPNLGYVTSSYDRPEFWNIYFGALNPDTSNDGAIGFTGPDYSVGTLDYESRKAIYYREERAKRPMNIKNIKTNLWQDENGEWHQEGAYGNFTYNYEVMSTFGDQGYYLRRVDDLLPDVIADALPETTNYHTLVAQTASVDGNFFGGENNRQYDNVSVVPGQEATQATGGGFTVKGRETVTDGHSINIDGTFYGINAIVFGGVSVSTGSSDTEFFDNFRSALISNQFINFWSVNYVPGGTAGVTGYALSILDRAPGGGIGLEFASSPSWSNGESLNDPFTISFYVNQPTADGTNRTIYSESSGGNVGKEVSFGTLPLGGGPLRFRFPFYDQNKNFQWLDYRLDDFLINNANTLTHVVITCDGTLDSNSACEIYVNGALQSWSSNPSFPNGTNTAAPVDSFRVGCQTIANSNGTGMSIDGSTAILDELMIFNTSFVGDQATINQIYNFGQQLDYSNLNNLAFYNNVQAFYTFSEANDGFANGDTIHNKKVNAANLTVYDNSFDKIRQSTKGAGISGDTYAEFTISPLNVGDYGNFNVNIDAGNESFYNAHSSSGGQNFIPESITGETNITDTQDRSTGSANVIRTRFSAPGGPEVNSSGYLDVATQQYSVHNSLNYRNLTVRASGSGEDDRIRLSSHAGRREGLAILRSRHQGKFGLDSKWGTVASGDYNEEASFHKQHRNNNEMPYTVLDGQGVEVPKVRNDNDYYHRPLPATDFQYSWINNALNGEDAPDQFILERAPKNGMIKTDVGYHEAIIFNTGGVELDDCSADPIADLFVSWGGNGEFESSETPTILNVLETGTEDGSKILFSNLDLLNFSYNNLGCSLASTELSLVEWGDPTDFGGEIALPELFYNPQSIVDFRYDSKRGTYSDTMALSLVNVSLEQPEIVSLFFYPLRTTPGGPTTIVPSVENFSLAVVPYSSVPGSNEISLLEIYDLENNWYENSIVCTDNTERQLFVNGVLESTNTDSAPWTDFPNIYYLDGGSTELRSVVTTCDGFFEDDVTMTLSNTTLNSPLLRANVTYWDEVAGQREQVTEIGTDTVVTIVSWAPGVSGEVSEQEANETEFGFLSTSDDHFLDNVGTLQYTLTWNDQQGTQGNLVLSRMPTMADLPYPVYFSYNPSDTIVLGMTVESLTGRVIKQSISGITFNAASFTASVVNAQLTYPNGSEDPQAFLPRAPKTTDLDLTLDLVPDSTNILDSTNRVKVSEVNAVDSGGNATEFVFSRDPIVSGDVINLYYSYNGGTENFTEFPNQRPNVEYSPGDYITYRVVVVRNSLEIDQITITLQDAGPITGP